jgi:hypothetical protein
VNHVATVLTWVVAVLATASMISGLIALRSEPGSPAALSRLWMGLFIILEAVPRLAGWPSGAVLALSTLALMPLALAVRALYRR